MFSVSLATGIHASAQIIKFPTQQLHSDGTVLDTIAEGALAGQQEIEAKQELVQEKTDEKRQVEVTNSAVTNDSIIRMVKGAGRQMQL